MQTTQPRINAPGGATHTKSAAIVIMIAALVGVLRAIFGLFVWRGLLQASGAIEGTDTVNNGLKLLYSILMWFLPVMAVLALVFAVSLWMLKGWARIGATVLFALDLFLNIALTLTGAPMGIGAIPALLADVIVLVLLNLPASSRSFRES